jgi:hypothetical protein
MNVVVALLLGAGLAVAAVALTRQLFEAPVFQDTNHRGRRIAVGVGLLVPLVGFVAAGILAVTDRLRHVEVRAGSRAVVVLTVAGFALLGLLDDVAGNDSETDKGFRGHVRALASGRLTTGAVKLIGGGALALMLSAALHPTGWVDLLVDAALVALAANTANLFDRAPGRCGKVTVAAFAVLWGVTGADTTLAGVALVAGAAIGLLPGDLDERYMLGDAGANAYGAALGLGVVVSCGLGARVAVLAVLVVLNVLSEFASFSRVIDTTPPLRWFDRLGRREVD